MTQASDRSGGPSGDESTGSAQQKATQVAQAAKDSGSEVAQTAVEQAKTVVGETGQQARDLIGEARGQLREQAGSQQQKAAGGLRALVEELHQMTEKGGQSGPATQIAHQVANRVGQAADWLEQREPGDLLEEVRRLGRRRPGAFLAGAALLGVVAGRLTRGVTAAASSDDSQPPQNYQPAPPPSDAGFGYPAETSSYIEAPGYIETPGYAPAGGPQQPMPPYPPSGDTGPIYGAPPARPPTASPYPPNQGTDPVYPAPAGEMPAGELPPEPGGWR